MKIGICGHFGGKEVCLDGQTVKTKIVYDALSENYGKENVIINDTYKIKKRLIPVFFGTVKLFAVSDACIMLPAHNGIKVFTPLFCILKKIFKKKIYYSVIGGWLAKYISDKPKLEKRLKSFDGIFVETTTMKANLEKMGFENISVIANFKHLNIVSEFENEYSTPYRLCTFSRVMKEKGIAEAIEAIKKVNKACGKNVFALDIYGPVDSSQTEWFENLKNDFPEYVKYCGCVPFDKSVDVLKDYFALLFPTLFYTEGIPGTIIDAYAAAIPVISAKWESFADIVDDGITGIGYEFGNTDALVSVLADIADKPSTVTEMKVACAKKAECYLPQNAVAPMISILDGAN